MRCKPGRRSLWGRRRREAASTSTASEDQGDEDDGDEVAIGAIGIGIGNATNHLALEEGGRGVNFTEFCHR